MTRLAGEGDSRAADQIGKEAFDSASVKREAWGQLYQQHGQPFLEMRNF